MCPSSVRFFSPTAESFGVSAQIGSGVVRGGPEARFHQGSTKGMLLGISPERIFLPQRGEETSRQIGFGFDARGHAAEPHGAAAHRGPGARAGGGGRGPARTPAEYTNAGASKVSQGIKRSCCEPSGEPDDQSHPERAS